MVIESSPERINTGMRVGEDKLGIGTIVADRANDGLGLSTAGRCFHETG